MARLAGLDMTEGSTGGWESGGGPDLPKHL